MAGGGGSEPNLTPFIDLFSVLICFLLMTSAWLSLEAFPVQIEKTPDGTTSAQSPTPPPDPGKEKKVSLSVTLNKESLKTKEGEIERTIRHQADGSLDESAIQILMADWRSKYPDRKDVILNTDQSVSYGRMIALYDLLVKLDWSDVGINPN